jgi:hypothetical protein
MKESNPSWFSRLLERIRRERRFTRREQLSLVGASHVGILFGTWVIVSTVEVSPGLPRGFVFGELAILAMTAPFALRIRLPVLEDLFRFASGSLPPEAADLDHEARRVESAKKERVENFAGFILILASIVQFAALALLLWGTGGPIESPFAEMALIIAVFTPYIANNPATIGVVVLASIGYYAFLILLYTSDHSPEAIHVFKQVLESGALDGANPLGKFEEALETSIPSEWAYFLVNVMILVGGIMFTVFESSLRKAEMSAVAAAAASEFGANSNGEGASTDVPPPAADESTPAGDGSDAQPMDGAGGGNSAGANGDTSPSDGQGDKPAGDDLDEDATTA